MRVITPDNETFWLNRDFNMNEYSGEMTLRFVLNGPESTHLPVSSKYVFEFLKDDALSAKCGGLFSREIRIHQELLLQMGSKRDKVEL